MTYNKEYYQQNKLRYIWFDLVRRCTNPLHARYEDYGGRGIIVCSHWLVFQNFAADVGPPPEGLTLERIDNDGNYEPSNCRWATYTEQNQNKRAYRRACNNRTGITGVSFHEGKKNWRAFGGRALLYQGKDFDAACRARLKWEDCR